MKYFIAIVLCVACLGAVKMPNGAKDAWLLMQPAAVQPHFIVIIGDGTLNLWTATSLIRPNWTTLGTFTNTASVLATNPPTIAYYAVAVAWNDEQWADGFNLYIDSTNRYDQGTNTIGWSATQPGKHKCFVTAYNDMFGYESPPSATVIANAKPVFAPGQQYFTEAANKPLSIR